MFWEVALIVLLLVANGVFAMAEIAVVSARKSRLQKQAEHGNERAREALALANSPNDFLSTVQIGITLVGVLAGAFSGATLADRLGGWLDQYAWIAPHGHAAAFAIVVSIITYFSLIFGELVPKRLALNNPEKIAALVARPMGILSKLASPVVFFLSWSTDCSLKAIGLRPENEPPVSEDEVRGLIEQGLGAGVFHQAEKDMVEGVFRLDEQMVGDLMTPATRIVWLNLDDPDEASWRAIVASGHSWFPVYQGNRDNVVGVVSVKALWANSSLTGATNLRSVVSQPVVVPESMLALKLVENFRKTGLHFALVADEFGSVRGLVTLHDVVEAIVGTLPEKGQRSRPQARRREDGSFLIDAAMDIVDVKRSLRIKKLPREERGEFLSIGGFLIDQLEHIPTEGEKVVSSGYVFEVVDMDHQRIDKILATKLGGAKPAAVTVQ
jgi:putative hemolysin